MDCVVEELKLLQDQLVHLTSKADNEARCEITMAREQVVLVFVIMSISYFLIVQNMLQYFICL